MNATRRQPDSLPSNPAVRVFGLLVIVSLICLSTGRQLTRSQEAPKKPEAIEVDLPWCNLTAELLDEEARAGGNVHTLLSERSPRQACPVAVEYLKLLSGGRELVDCKSVDLQELATSQSFWLTASYLIRNSASSVGIDWAAAVWREVVYLPDNCHFESLLFDAGHGDLLRALFAGCSKLSDSRLNWLIQPLQVKDPDEELLSDLWDYFTGYGGDVAAGDHLARLDELAAALDLNPSYRAKWRKSEIGMKLVKTIRSWKHSQRWEFMMAGIRLRKSKPDEYAKIRTGILNGQAVMIPKVFSE